MLYNKRKARIWWRKTKPWLKRVAFWIGINIIIWGNLGIEFKLALDSLIWHPVQINVPHKEQKQLLNIQAKETPQTQPKVVKAAAVEIEMATLSMTDDEGRKFLQQYGIEQGMKQADINLLAKIIQAESGWEHFCTKVKTGCKSVGAVKTGPTQDYGYAQIHLPTHKARLKKLGIDIMKPQDNIKFAVMLFQEHQCRPDACQPWKASMHRPNGTGWAD